MPVNVGSPNAYNLGKDCVFTVVSPDGTIINSAKITEGTVKQKTKQINSRPLNGPPVYAEIPDGWEGHVKLDRFDNSIDAAFANNEQLYWTSNALLSFAIVQTIENADGSISQYQFNQCACKLDNAGDFKGDGKVEYQISFICGRRFRIG
jgi:hypothetical protein